MYDKTITVFNGYASKTTGKSYWYPHILSGVDLITDHGAILKKYGTAYCLHPEWGKGDGAAVGRFSGAVVAPESMGGAGK